MELKGMLCGICFDTIPKGEIQWHQCSHKFHQTCLAAWIMEQRPPTCPMCKIRFKKQVCEILREHGKHVEGNLLSFRYFKQYPFIQLEKNFQVFLKKRARRLYGKKCLEKTYIAEADMDRWPQWNSRKFANKLFYRTYSRKYNRYMREFLKFFHTCTWECIETPCRQNCFM